MPKKGDVLLVFDSGEIYNEEVENVRKDWDGNIDTLKEFTWQRLTDGVRYTDEWVYFKRQLTNIMEEKNKTVFWESPDYLSDSQTSIRDLKFRADNGDALLRKLITQPYPIGFVSIAAWGKEGFCIEPEWQREKCVLPACKGGFYRDWDRNGICVAVPGEDYI